MIQSNRSVSCPGKPQVVTSPNQPSSSQSSQLQVFAGEFSRIRKHAEKTAHKHAELATLTGSSGCGWLAAPVRPVGNDGTVRRGVDKQLVCRTSPPLPTITARTTVGFLSLTSS